MSKRRTLFLGIGCIVLLACLSVAVFMTLALRGGSLPDRMVLAIRLDGPIVEIKVEDPLAELMGESVLSMRELRDALVRAADDERVSGVRLRIDSFGGGFANAQEIRALLQRVNAAGKWTAVYMDTAGEFVPGNAVYWIASVCDEISINPLGDVNLIGLSASSPFIRGTLDKLGVRPEFPGRGRYKTARFMYTHTDFTPAHEEMMRWLLGSLTDQMLADIASGRGFADPEHARELMNNGPYFGQEAVDADLVDYLEDWTGFTSRLKEKDPAAEEPVGLSSYLQRSHASSGGPKIAVVTAVGAIMRGENRQSVNPLLGGDVMGAETIARAWRAVRKANGIKAVVFRIDSPGGSAVASEIIRAEMARTAEEIPVVVSMSNLAASGGYWITCGAKRIVASPGSLVGSIGVFAGHLNLKGFWNDKLGVSFGRMDLADNANFYGDLEDWTDEQRAIMDRMLDRIYNDFLDRVAASREALPDRDAVHQIGEGRVFTGQQGTSNGLVDVLGGFDEALVEAKRLAGIPDDARVTLVDYPKALPWWQQVVKHRRDDDVALRAAYAELQRAWQTGVLENPGVLWMPPVYIQ